MGRWLDIGLNPFFFCILWAVTLGGVLPYNYGLYNLLGTVCATVKGITMVFKQ